MKKYDPSSIEPKWQQVWADTNVYAAENGDTSRPKYFYLVEFPYPSGDGLHVGHVLSYTALDIMARHKRMQGYNVLYPMGFDEFGLPTENYAIKHKIAPQVATERNVANFRRQLKALGLSFDWNREVRTSDPNYYKWTQWIFLKLLEKGLAYQAELPINWCPFEKTGLANEEVVDGKHERCGTPVEKKLLKQWVLKITAYADRLVEDLQSVDYLDRIATQQVNWVGRSEGAEITWKLQGVGAPRTIVLVHGFQGKPSDYDWLKHELEAQGHKVIVPVMPNPKAPVEKDWVDTVLNATTYDENTVILGYSLGSVAALKAVERMKSNIKIGGLVLAAGFIDTKFADKSRSFEDTFTWEFDAAAIKSHVSDIKLLHDSTDTAVTREQGDRLSEFLGVPLTVVQAERPHFCAPQEPELFKAFGSSNHTVTVYTTRPDTLFGATFLVVSPEVAQSWLNAGWKADKAVVDYVDAALKASELSRQEESKTKTGVDTGIRAVHPLTGDLIPVWVADYVLGSYGTGAIMAVPAHDERDSAFAQAFNLPIVNVLNPEITRDDAKDLKDFKRHKKIVAIVENSKGEILTINWGPKLGGRLTIGGTIEGSESPETTAMREVAEETGYHDLEVVAVGQETMRYKYFAFSKKEGHDTDVNFVHLRLKSDSRRDQQLDESEKNNFKVEWVSRDVAEREIIEPLHRYGFEKFVLGKVFTGEAPLTNSGEFDGLAGTEAKHAIVKALFDKGAGKGATKYRLRDWIFSRQHYWGEPIPVVHCEACKVKVDKTAVELSFYNQSTWDRLVRGQKTVETRAEDPGRKFSEASAGSMLKCVNRVTGEVAYFEATTSKHYPSLSDFFEDKAAVAGAYGGSDRPIPATLADLEAGYQPTPDYLDRIKQHGLVAWEITRLIPGVVPVPADQLPVELPKVESYEPTDTGESPLAAITDWVNTTCPKCGGPAKRETDTMPNWAGSSWYYLRYTDPTNDQAFASEDALKYWTPVDLYNGGMEHTTLHLLYSRFWHKFLYDEGLVPTPEPYARRRSHGMILGPDGQKMSKSKGNVINPDHVVEKYGADTIRLYEMFMGPFDEVKAWSEDHLNGVSRFIYRVWTWLDDMTGDAETLSGSQGYQEDLGAFTVEVDRAVHKTLKKAGENIESMRFNTAVSSFMELMNFLASEDAKRKLRQANAHDLRLRTVEAVTLMLAPFTPHLAEEIWHENLRQEGSVHRAAWPKYDPELIKDDVVTVVVQVNGKVRGELALPADATEDDAKAAAQADAGVARHLDGKTIQKTIVVPRKIVNFVVKD